MQEVGLSRDDRQRAPRAHPRHSAGLNSKHNVGHGSLASEGGGQAPKGASPVGGRRRGRRRYIVLRRLLGATFMIAIVAVALFADKTRMKKLTQLVPEIETLVVYSGFGIEQVTVKGQRFTLVADIFEALDLGSQRSFASFDAAAARARLEALPWVASGELRRIYPNQLEVRISEREAFAVWARNDRFALIDADGAVLGEVASLDNWERLPRLAGKGAAPVARAFFETLANYPALARRLEKAERVGERRWSLHLDKKIVIHLPASGVETALRELADWQGFAGVIDRGHAVIDLRAGGRIAVRPEVPASATSQAPKTIADLIQPAG